MNRTQELVNITVELSRKLQGMTFERPGWIYNPLDYAFPTHREYLERFTPGPGALIFLGMNPGPWGMAQTGIPFGAISAVRDWMGISRQLKIGRPEREHPRVPVQGFDCRRDEVSGRRLWGLMAKRYPAAEDFFAGHFVINYCPLMFLDDGGRNLTPDKLPLAERRELFAVCSQALEDTIELLQPSRLLGIGKFAEGRLRQIFASTYPIDSILHPSPASPAANRDWEGQVTRRLEELAIWNQATPPSSP